MPEYLSPGVYMEEVDKGTKPIEAVGTALAAFVGYTEKADRIVKDENGEDIVEIDALLRKPTLITNWSQYKQKFGGSVEGAYTPDAVYGYFANGGTRCYVVSIKTLGKNGVGKTPGNTITVLASDGITPLLQITSKRNKLITLVFTPGTLSGPTDSPEGQQGNESPRENLTFTLSIKAEGERKPEQYTNVTITDIEKTVQQKSQLIGVKVLTKVDMIPMFKPYEIPAVVSSTAGAPITVKDYEGDLSKREGIAGLEPISDITMLCVPDLMTVYKENSNKSEAMKTIKIIQTAVINYCETQAPYCFAILDAPPKMMPEEILNWRNSIGNYDTSRAALYYPWIEVADQTGSGKGITRLVPPSGHIAGIYARSDNTRGVHKAPANEVIQNVIGLDVEVTKGEHDMLNPIGINVIRSFPGRGIRVWGARTLSSDPSWRYINVRRLFNMIEASIERGTQWVVFEPNDFFLWSRVRRDVGAFLKIVWRSGALFGLTPEQAFYVKCDEETNPPEIRDVGQLVIEVGLAPVKPAEFVIFRISQWAGQDAEV